VRAEEEVEEAKLAETIVGKELFTKGF